MTKVLAIRSSILAEASASNQLVHGALSNFQASNPAARIVERDLSAQPIPHLDIEAATGLRWDPVNPVQEKARALSDKLIEEVNDADVLLIGAPMYNFGIPSGLKSWFDYILRAGITFRYTEAGPEGLVKGKRAVVVLTRGGLYSEGPMSVMDAQEPHLLTLLNFFGITDIAFVRAEKLAFGPEHREAAIAKALDEIVAEFRPALAAAALPGIRNTAAFDEIQNINRDQ